MSFAGMEPVEFIPNPSQVVASSTDGARSWIQRLDEQIKVRRLMESRLTARLDTLRAKEDELEESLRVVSWLQESRDMQVGESMTRYELCEGMYVKATVDTQSLHTVKLWLGAKVMVEYTLEEAVALLERNLETARESLTETKKSLESVRAETVTAEINMSRVYNAEVRLRQQRQGETKKEQQDIVSN